MANYCTTKDNIMNNNWTIKRLLSEYNENNAKNSVLTEYICQNNIFQMVGKERSEIVHSNFIACLIAGLYFQSGCSESTAMHFLDILLKRSTMQGIQCDISKLETGILTRKSRISIIDVRTEYTLAKYVEDNRLTEDYIISQFEEYKGHAKFDTLIDNVRKSKLDIYIKMKVGEDVESGKGRTVEIFIENKVGCKQNDLKLDKNTTIKQTDKYYKVCSNNAGKGNRNLQLYVYLSPVSKRELNNAVDAEVNPNFIQINYQDILNQIIEPLLDGQSLSEQLRMRLADYVNCLELPSLPDMEDASVVRSLSIMATSQKEQLLVEEYLNDKVNAALLEAVIGNKLMGNTQLYSYRGSRMLTFEDAVGKALADFIASTSEIDALQKMDIIEKRGGNENEYNPFLIYCPASVEDKFVPYELYVYDSRIYLTVADALHQALLDGWDASLAVGEFDIFDVRGKGTTKSVYAEAGIEMPYGMFMRKNISPDRLDKINSELKRIYKHSQAPQILKIDAERYHSFISTCKAGMQKVADSKRDAYIRVGQTNFYYRSDVENHYSEISKILTEIIPENINAEEKELLDNFYDSNRLFLLSIYKILTENTQEPRLYNYRKKCLKELCMN